MSKEEKPGNNIKILDCTLRDGGYVNGFHFGLRRINSIINNLVSSKIDIIECGFLSNISKYDLDHTEYLTTLDLKLDKTKHKNFSLMINYGEFDINKLNKKSGKINIIRLAFHKQDYKKAIKEGISIIKKGYKLYLQPTNTPSYTVNEYKELINASIKANVDGLYIVDTFGTMTSKDIDKYFALADQLLPKKMVLGVHFHNNYQLAYSNALHVLSKNTNRTIYIDSSLFGMGRGAGNLPTELLANQINIVNGNKYSLLYIYKCLYNDIIPLKSKYVWGYSIPQLIAAIHNCHPNYITYLLDNGISDYNKINEIISRLPSSQKLTFDKPYATKLLRNNRSDCHVQKNKK